MSRSTPVLHILNGEEYSGLERVVDDLCEMSPEYGYQFHLALLKPGQMQSKMRSRTAILHDCPMRHRFHWSIARHIASIATAHHCELIHSHTIRGALIAHGVKRMTGLPWVCHLHCHSLHDSSGTLINCLNFGCELAIVRRATKVVCVSQAVADFARKFYRLNPDKLTVIPNGVAPAEAEKKYDPSDKPKILAALGLFRPNKGIEFIVLALRTLIDSGYPVRLKVIGGFADPGYEARIRKLVADLSLQNQVEFLGFVANVTAVLQQCDILVFSTLRAEGMPLAVLECMATGVAVVATDIPGVTELLTNGAGILVSPKSSAALCRGIEALLTNPTLYRAISTEARNRQRKFYSVQSMGTSIFDCYNRILTLNKTDRTHADIPEPS